MIEKYVGEILKSQGYIIDIASRFETDYRCPLSNYRIDKVIESTNKEIFTYSDFFEIDVLGNLALLSSN